MTNTALLNNIQHKDLKVIARFSAAFGDNVNQVAIVPTEFEAIQREYPILLAKSPEGEYQALALLGLDKDENLFLDQQGWHARYVPGMQVRGPFLIGFHEQLADGEPRREPMIHVDLDHPRISRREGEPLFLPQGGHSPYLEHITRVLRLMHQGMALSVGMYAAFAELELIEPVALRIDLNDREQYQLADYYTIGEERLATLSGANLDRLHKAGFLQAAYFVASSLKNINRLIDLKNGRRAAS
jgi:SapC